MFGIDDAIIAGVAGSVLGGVTSGIFNTNSARTANERAVENTNNAFAASQQEYATRYQTTAKDMKLAGINPIMAATGGFNVSGQPTMSAAAVHQAAPMQMESFTTAAKSAKDVEKSDYEMDKLSAETDNIVQDTEKKRLEALHEIERIAKTKADIVLTGEQTEKTKAETLLTGETTGKTRAETTKIQTETGKIYVEMAHLEQQIQQSIKQIQVMSEEIKLKRAETGLTTAKTATEKAQAAKVIDEVKILDENVRYAGILADKMIAQNKIYQQPVGEYLGNANAVLDGLKINTGAILGMGKPGRAPSNWSRSSSGSARPAPARTPAESGVSINPYNPYGSSSYGGN